jgi:hypothetical protein
MTTDTPWDGRIPDELAPALDEMIADQDKALPDAGLAAWYEQWKTLTPEERRAELAEAEGKLLAEFMEMHGDQPAGGEG